ncbi:hypothetical protein CBL_10851 [Carabus blaptoides fortunei]
MSGRPSGLGRGLQPPSRMQMPRVGTSISKTRVGQVTTTASGTRITDTVSTSSTSITARGPAARSSMQRPSGMQRPSSGLTKPTSSTRITTGAVPGASGKLTTRVTVSGANIRAPSEAGKPARPSSARTASTKSAAAKAKECGAACAAGKDKSGKAKIRESPLSQELPEPRHVQPGRYYMPMKGAMGTVDSPAKLKQKLAKYTPTTLSHWKNELDDRFAKGIGPVREAHPDMQSGYFRVPYGDPKPEEMEPYERMKYRDLMEQTINPYLPEEQWSESLKEAMKLGEDEDEDEESDDEWSMTLKESMDLKEGDYQDRGSDDELADFEILEGQIDTTVEAKLPKKPTVQVRARSPQNVQYQQQIRQPSPPQIRQPSPQQARRPTPPQARQPSPQQARQVAKQQAQFVNVQPQPNIEEQIQRLADYVDRISDGQTLVPAQKSPGLTDEEHAQQEAENVARYVRNIAKQFLAREQAEGKRQAVLDAQQEAAMKARRRAREQEKAKAIALIKDTQQFVEQERRETSQQAQIRAAQMASWQRAKAQKDAEAQARAQIEIQRRSVARAQIVDTQKFVEKEQLEGRRQAQIHALQMEAWKRAEAQRQANERARARTQIAQTQQFVEHEQQAGKMQAQYQMQAQQQQQQRATLEAQRRSRVRSQIADTQQFLVQEQREAQRQAQLQRAQMAQWEQAKAQREEQEGTRAQNEVMDWARSRAQIAQTQQFVENEQRQGRRQAQLDAQQQKHEAERSAQILAQRAAQYASRQGKSSESTGMLKKTESECMPCGGIPKRSRSPSPTEGRSARSSPTRSPTRAASPRPRPVIPTIVVTAPSDTDITGDEEPGVPQQIKTQEQKMSRLEVPKALSRIGKPSGLKKPSTVRIKEQATEQVESGQQVAVGVASDGAISKLPARRQLRPPSKLIKYPGTSRMIETRQVTPSIILTPVGSVEARQETKIDRNTQMTRQGAVVDTHVVGTRKISPGVAEQTEVVQRDVIPPTEFPKLSTSRIKFVPRKRKMPLPSTITTRKPLSPVAPLVMEPGPSPPTPIDFDLLAQGYVSPGYMSALDQESPPMFDSLIMSSFDSSAQGMYGSPSPKGQPKVIEHVVIKTSPDQQSIITSRYEKIHEEEYSLPTPSYYPKKPTPIALGGTERGSPVYTEQQQSVYSGPTKTVYSSSSKTRYLSPPEAAVSGGKARYVTPTQEHVTEAYITPTETYIKEPSDLKKSASPKRLTQVYFVYYVKIFVATNILGTYFVLQSASVPGVSPSAQAVTFSLPTKKPPRLCMPCSAQSPEPLLEPTPSLTLPPKKSPKICMPCGAARSSPPEEIPVCMPCGGSKPSPPPPPPPEPERAPSPKKPTTTPSTPAISLSVRPPPVSPTIPLDVSIQIPADLNQSDLNTIEALVDEEKADVLVSKMVSSPLKEKLERMKKKKPKCMRLLEETLDENIPMAHHGDTMTSDIMAAMMEGEEKGITATTKSPKKTYDALFPMLEDEPIVEISSVSPAPLQDIMVPLGEADTEDIAIVTEEIEQVASISEEIPTGDLYAETVAKTQEDIAEEVAEDQEQKEVEKEKVGEDQEVDKEEIRKKKEAEDKKKKEDKKKEDKKIAQEQQESEERRKSEKGKGKKKDDTFIPSETLEGVKAPWELDISSLENLVGGKLFTTVEDILISDDSIRKTEDKFEYVLETTATKFISNFQARGSQWPSWFRGYCSVFPHNPNYVKLEKSPSRIMATAWKIFAPPTTLTDRDVSFF